MKWTQLSLLLSLFPLLLIACNTGGFTAPAGTQCADDYSPIPMTSTGQKVTLNKADNQKATGNAQLQPGTYNYTHSDMFFVQNNYGNPAPLLVHIADAPTPDGVSHPGVVCLRNMSSKMAPLQQAADITTAMVIDANLNMTVTTRNLNFNIAVVNSNSVINMPPAVPDPATVTSGDLPFQNVKVNYFVVKNGLTNVQIQASYPQSNGDTLYVQVDMTYVPLPPTAKPQVTPPPPDLAPN